MRKFIYTLGIIGVFASTGYSENNCAVLDRTIQQFEKTFRDLALLKGDLVKVNGGLKKSDSISQKYQDLEGRYAKIASEFVRDKLYYAGTKTHTIPAEEAKCVGIQKIINTLFQDLAQY